MKRIIFVILISMANVVFAGNKPGDIYQFTYLKMVDSDLETLWKKSSPFRLNYTLVTDAVPPATIRAAITSLRRKKDAAEMEEVKNFVRLIFREAVNEFDVDGVKLDLKEEMKAKSKE